MKPYRFLLIALAIVVCDQLTKWVVVAHLPVGASRPVLGHVLWLSHTRNTGGAFSLFPARNEWFLVVAAIAVVALVYAYARYHRHDLAVSGALALALGGAIGNLIDRARFGYVVDFFDLRVWPVFNIADAAITTAIVVLAGHVVLSYLHPARGDGLSTRPAPDVAAPEEPSRT